jgi:uncharacterized protein YbjT (DUF2867 family)
MRIVIAGGHGKIALLLAQQLAQRGHEPVGLIRNPEHRRELISAGAVPLLIDLEAAREADVSAMLAGADAAVFAAGAGPDSGPLRKMTVDRDGAVLLGRAAVRAGLRRLAVISARDADNYVADSDDMSQIYLRAKSEADQAIRALDLDWTIVRPGAPVDTEPTGAVTVGKTVGAGSIPRSDVAEVVLQVLVDRLAIGSQFEVISGETPIAEALRAL